MQPELNPDASSMETSDCELLIQYRNGDTRALEQMVERYRRPLFGFILNMIAEQDDANDFFQEVWFRAIRHLDRYQDDKFLSWLFRIAHNLVVDRYRASKPMVSLEKENDGGTALQDRLADPAPAPATQVGHRDVERLIAAAVETLPPEQKAVFLMRTGAELSFKEIAAIQGVSINTALARMQYALAKLRILLQDER